MTMYQKINYQKKNKIILYYGKMETVETHYTTHLSPYVPIVGAILLLIGMNVFIFEKNENL